MNNFAKNVAKVDFKTDQRSCGECHYFWFKKLGRWCFHPERNYEIEDFVVGCDKWSDQMIADKTRVERVRG